METYIIVEIEAGASSSETRNITRIIRSYESKSRAEQDLELLDAFEYGPAFKIITVPYIDR